VVRRAGWCPRRPNRRILWRDPALIELAEQLAETVGEDRHLDLFERDADDATAVAGLQEERALAGFSDRSRSRSAPVDRR
jgi:hypothetical protein